MKFESDVGKKTECKSSRHNKSVGIPIKFEVDKADGLSEVLSNRNKDFDSFNLSLVKEDPLQEKLQMVLTNCKHLAKLLVLKKCVKVPEEVSEINFLVEFFKKRKLPKEGDNRALKLTEVIGEIIEGLNSELKKN